MQLIMDWRPTKMCERQCNSNRLLIMDSRPTKMHDASFLQLQPKFWKLKFYADYIAYN